MFSCFSFALIIDTKHDCEHDIHMSLIHNILAEDYGVCPNCGEELEGRVTATCTESGGYYYFCPNGDYSDRGTMPALGHDYESYIEEEATCTKQGVMRYECTRCDEYYDETIEALGHNYLYKVTKEATCTEEGIRTYTCTRCYEKYTKTIPAIGHDIEYEELAATCTEKGYKKGVCKRCDEKSLKVFPALGHSLGEFKIIKEATCTENGEKEAICTVCGESIKEGIPMLGHKYSDEWTVEKEAGFFSEGLISKTCIVCSEKISKTIPKKDPTVLILGGLGIGAVVAGSILFYLNGKAKKPSRTTKKEETIDRDVLKPEFEDRTILVRSDNEELILNLKDKKFLKVINCESEELKDSATENEPDLIVVEIRNNKEFKVILKLKEELSDFVFGLILDKKLIDKHLETLKALKEEKKITDYVTPDSNVDIIQVKLVLPVLKPKLNSDESLTNIGMVADALGIPYISKVIDLYVTGRDLKTTLEEEDKGISETATIIGDIASILGLEQVASVAGLVDDFDSIKSALDKESGVHEKSAGIEGAKDIVDVVSDIANKG